MIFGYVFIVHGSAMLLLLHLKKSRKSSPNMTPACNSSLDGQLRALYVFLFPVTLDLLDPEIDFF